jgi:ATP-dependent Clp protease ATP-binding subunit ClpX
VSGKRHYCGFCGKARDEVERMLAGPCIEVCNECIDMMHKMIHEPKPLLPLKPAKASKPQTVISFRDAAIKRRT